MNVTITQATILSASNVFDPMLNVIKIIVLLVITKRLIISLPLNAFSGLLVRDEIRTNF